MIENGMRYLRGYVKIQIQGYSPERFLNLCSYHHILIWGLAYEDHCYELCMSVRDFKRIRPFAKKTHTKVRVKEAGCKEKASILSEREIWISVFSL